MRSMSIIIVNFVSEWNLISRFKERTQTCGASDASAEETFRV
jgi:hypothetical protein